MINEAKQKLKARALELRKAGDRTWEKGDKPGSDACHRDAAALEEQARLLPDVLPDPPLKCLAQREASAWIDTLASRRREKMVKKGIAPIFAFELYAINCDRHAAEGMPKAAHIDLLTSAVEALTPEGLQHAVSATEAVLAQLKQRLA